MKHKVFNQHHACKLQTVHHVALCCMYLYVQTDRGAGCCCVHHMGAAAHSIWGSMNSAALPHWRLPPLPVRFPVPPSQTISAILLSLTPLHRQHHHNQIILLGPTDSWPAERLSQWPRTGRKQKMYGLKNGTKNMAASGFKMQIRASEWLHTHQRSFNTSPGTKLYQHKWTNNSLVSACQFYRSEKSFAVMWN